MTVEVYSSPGTSTYQSTRYSATVNGASAYVYGYSRTAVMPTQAWSAGATVEPAWFQFGANETATVAITRLAGAITSAVVYPKDKGVTQSIVGGVLYLQVPTNVRLWVECNGDRVPIIVQSRPLKPALPSPRTDWTTLTKTVSSINTGTNVITCSASHGYTAGQRVVLATTGTLPSVTGTALSLTEVYYVLSPSGADLKLARTSGGTEIDFTGTGTGTLSMRTAQWTDAATSLYFPAGVHTIGRLFKVGAGVDIYTDGGAVLVGSWDVRGSTTYTIRGAGQMFATYALWSDVQALPFEQLIEYAPVLGLDFENFAYDGSISGQMFAAWPYFFAREGVAHWEYCIGVSPWNYNNDGFDCSVRTDGEESTVDHCLMFCGDDGLYLESNWFSLHATDLFVANSNGGAFLFGYWGEANAGKFQTLTDCDCVSLAISDEVSGVARAADSTIKLWNDNRESEAAAGYGRFNIVIDGLNVWGEHQNRLLSIENYVYPFPGGLARDGLGDVADITLRNVVVEETPDQLSPINGTDWGNTPHDIRFENVEIEGVRLTAANFGEFFERNVYPYNLFVEGQPVVTAVDLCNRALAYVGESPYITSIAPPDDTKPAKLCARFFWQAFNEVAQGHEWAWSTTRAALVEVADGGNETWRYCYEIPAGMLRCIEVMPKGGYDGFRDQSGDRTRYRIERDAGGIQRIYSNLSDAWIRYSVYVTDPNLLDPWAQEAVALNLAAKLVAAITQGGEGRRNMVDYLQLANAHIARAKANDGNQRVTVAAPAAGVPWLGEGRA